MMQQRGSDPNLHGGSPTALRSVGKDTVAEDDDDGAPSWTPPFRSRRQQPSILMDSWEFRKIAPEGSVLPNALLSWDVDGDDVEEVIVGTTEGLLCVLKQDCRLPIFTHAISATISVVLYSSIFRRLVIVTLEGRCEVLDNFLCPPTHPAHGSTHSSNANLPAGDVHVPHTGSFTQLSEDTASRSRGYHSQTRTVGGSSSSPPRHPRRTAFLEPHQVEGGIPFTSGIFHIAANCNCGDLQMDGEVGGRLFLGSYDRRLYVYALNSGACIISIFFHCPITSLKCFSIPIGSGGGSTWNTPEPPHDSNTTTDGSPRGFSSTRELRGGRSPSVGFHALRSSANTSAEGITVVPLVAVATGRSLVMLPASPAHLHTWSIHEKQTCLPLTLVDNDALHELFSELFALPDEVHRSHDGLGAHAHTREEVSSRMEGTSPTTMLPDSLVVSASTSVQSGASQEVASAAGQLEREKAANAVAAAAHTATSESRDAICAQLTSLPITPIAPLMFVRIRPHGLEVPPILTLEEILSACCGIATAEVPTVLSTQFQPSDGAPMEEIGAASFRSAPRESNAKSATEEMEGMAPVCIDVAVGSSSFVIVGCAEDGRAWTLSFSTISTAEAASATTPRPPTLTPGDSPPASPLSIVDPSVSAASPEVEHANIIMLHRCGEDPSAGTHYDVMLPFAASTAVLPTVSGAASPAMIGSSYSMLNLGSTRSVDKLLPGGTSQSTLLTTTVGSSSAPGASRRSSPMVMKPALAILRCRCVWAGRLGEAPLVQRTRVFRVADDDFCFLCVNVNGTCFAVDAAKADAVICAVREDCSSFTVVVGPSSTSPDALIAELASGDVPRNFTNASSNNIAAADAAALTTATRPVSSVLKLGEHSGLSQSPNVGYQVNLLRGAHGRTVSCVCVSVEELCIYSVGETSISPRSRRGAAHSRMPSTLHRQAANHATKPAMAVSNPTLLDRAVSVIPVGQGSFAVSEDEGGAASFLATAAGAPHQDRSDQEVLLELGTLLMRGDGMSDAQLHLISPAERINRARALLVHGYTAKEWSILQRLVEQ